MIIKLETDENGDLLLPLGDELCSKLGWKVGDTIEWIDNGDGSWTMKKKDSKWVMVETVSMFRMRYMVEAPADHPEYALDTVTANEAKEFSQEHIGETIVSHRVVSLDEAIQICDQDNDYLKSWSDEQKINSFFTTMEEQGYDDGIQHSEYYYDTERNR